MKWKFSFQVLLTAIALAACQSTPPPPEAAARPSDAVTLRAGDVIRIAFPGAPNLDTQQQIRRDGKIALPLAGEIQAAGLSPSQLGDQIARLYASQLVTKEVSVTVVSSSFPVFVTGAVIKPGKVLADGPITALQAVMEAGGPDYAKANLKSVVVIRQEDGQTKHYSLNLKAVLDGRQNSSFYLRPSDVVYVPERFSWF
jgi:polysaccharide export outer membrane protein